MLVRTTNGKLISIVSNDKGVLTDATGAMWRRRGSLDSPGHAAYSTSINGDGEVIQFTKDELVRICKGTRAIQTPTTTDELRAATAYMEPEAAALAAEKPDQWFREVLSKAEETSQNPSSLAGHLLLDELDRLKPEEVPTEDPPLARETRKAPPQYKRAPRAKLQPGGFEDTFEGKRVLLTPKQTEFMERLEEHENWESGNHGKWLYGDLYAECLSDTMSPMSVGAMITTLREKGVIRTEYTRVDGRRVCKFQLTELGMLVYNRLCMKD